MASSVVEIRWVGIFGAGQSKQEIIGSGGQETRKQNTCYCWWSFFHALRTRRCKENAISRANGIRRVSTSQNGNREKWWSEKHLLNGCIQENDNRAAASGVKSGMLFVALGLTVGWSPAVRRRWVEEVELERGRNSRLRCLLPLFQVKRSLKDYWRVRPGCRIQGWGVVYVNLKKKCYRQQRGNATRRMKLAFWCSVLTISLREVAKAVWALIWFSTRVWRALNLMRECERMAIAFCFRRWKDGNRKWTKLCKERRMLVARLSSQWPNAKESNKVSNASTTLTSLSFSTYCVLLFWACKTGQSFQRTPRPIPSRQHISQHTWHTHPSSSVISNQTYQKNPWEHLKKRKKSNSNIF